jgi:hypothetical protein
MKPQQANFLGPPPLESASGLDDIFGHDFLLEALERALPTLAIVELNFGQRNSPRFLKAVFKKHLEGV